MRIASVGGSSGSILSRDRFFLFVCFVLDIVIISSESEDSDYNGALPGANM